MTHWLVTISCLPGNQETTKQERNWSSHKSSNWTHFSLYRTKSLRFYCTLFPPTDYITYWDGLRFWCVYPSFIVQFRLYHLSFIFSTMYESRFLLVEFMYYTLLHYIFFCLILKSTQVQIILSYDTVTIVLWVKVDPM